VATLPAEEQVSAANAGKDELKQAAKRVRESKKKTREEPADTAAGDDQSSSDADTVQLLKERVVQLTAENDALRKQVAELQARLGQ